VQRTANWISDAPGFGSTSIITNAKTPWEVVANPVGPDILGERQSYPLNFRQLEGNKTRPNAPVADGYSTSYSEITKLFGVTRNHE
jgi:hypothetical protein